MLDVYGPSGEYVGSLDMCVSPDLRILAVAAYADIAPQYVSPSEPSAASVQIVNLTRRAYRDAFGQVYDAWMVAPIDVPTLCAVPHFFAVGASSPTWLDRQIRRAETYVIATALRDHIRLPIDDAVRH